MREPLQNIALDLWAEPCNNYAVPFGRVWGCSSVGRSEIARGRVPRECTAALQAQGAAGRHHQGGQAALLLPQTRRKEAREGSIGAETQPEKSSERARLNEIEPPVPVVGGSFPF